VNQVAVINKSINLRNMKKLFFLFTTLSVIAIVITSFKPITAPRIYPELEAYFKSVETKAFSKDRMDVLRNIQYNVEISGYDFEDWNLIFFCSENTFRSQASQVFAQTLCYERKHKKINVFSAGQTSGEIDPRLIAYLTKIGYRIAKSEKEEKTMYEVKFSDRADPIILFSKTISDQSLPSKDITSVVVCDTEKEPVCKELKTPSTPLSLVFPKVLTTDDAGKVEATLKSIAAEMLYVTQK